jgi:hypothetical protein
VTRPHTLRVLHTSEAALAATLSPLLSVEAEYGAVVVEGSEYTAAHHQPKGSPYAGDHVVEGGRPAPCNDADIPCLHAHEGTILVSHLDLDTVGGVLRAYAHTSFLFDPEWAKGFWQLAAFVDTNGPHKRHLAGATDEDLARLDAWWAWMKANVPHLPRQGVTDVTDIVAEDCYTALCNILTNNPHYLEAGKRFREAEEALNAASFIAMNLRTGFIARRAPAEDDFVNHLYRTPVGVGRAIVSHNPHKGSVTISLADNVPGVSCRAVAQELWGPLAGGHDGIAGSPRDRRMTEDDALAAAQALEAALDRAAG